MTVNNNLATLLSGWVWSDFDSIIDFLTDYQANGSFATLKENVKYYKTINYAILVRLKDLRLDMKNGSDFVYTDKHGYDFLKKSSLKGGEILVSNVGNVGTSAIMPSINQAATLAPNMFLIYLSEYIEKRYFFYYCSSNRYWSEIARIKAGTGMPKINKKQYRTIVIPVSPLSEQRRIVAKIEELFTRLDAGVEALNKIKVQLKRYRQSVLKSAFEGKLTAEWREAHKDELEPASVLLEKLKKERIKSGKYKEFPPLDTSALPELPEGWVWAILDQISTHITDGEHLRPNTLARWYTFFISQRC